MWVGSGEREGRRTGGEERQEEETFSRKSGDAPGIGRQAMDGSTWHQADSHSSRYRVPWAGQACPDPCTPPLLWSGRSYPPALPPLPLGALRFPGTQPRHTTNCWGRKLEESVFRAGPFSGGHEVRPPFSHLERMAVLKGEMLTLERCQKESFFFLSSQEGY